MNSLKFCIPVLVYTLSFGCVSQQAHERTMEELEMAKQSSAQEIERLQKISQEQQAQVETLEEEKRALNQAVEKQDLKIAQREQELIQLRQEKDGLSEDLNTYEQVKNQRVQDLKKDLEAIYRDIKGMGNFSGDPSLTGDGPLFASDSVDFVDLAEALRTMRSSMKNQMEEYSKLRDMNAQLEKNLDALEDRLQVVDQLRKELDAMRAERIAEEERYARLKQQLEEVQAAREAQAAQFAKVKNEVLTVGEEIDRITRALEEKFGKSLMVTQHQDRLVLTMLGQVLFNSGEAELTPLGQKIMKQVGEVLASLPKKNIHVEGHTDNNPIYGNLKHRFATNWELSTARATTVLRYLIEETGMAPQVFAALGYADTRPTASNETEEGRAQNRRVEIVLYPERNSAAKTNDQVATLTP